MSGLRVDHVCVPCPQVTRRRELRCLVGGHRAASPTQPGVGNNFLLSFPSRCLPATAFLLLFAASPMLRDARGVEFDTDSLVCCRDVTTEEFAETHPQERLLEAEFHVTAIADSQLHDGTQYVYRFLSPAGQVRVADYRPQTQQATKMAGNVSVEKKTDRNKSLGISVSGSFENVLQGNIGSDIGSKKASNITYELKPPSEVVLVAGRIARGTGVYFKLRPSPERALEGSHRFVVVLRTPRSWRGDVIYVRCEAQRKRLTQMTSHSVSRFVVGLHVAGDQQAQSAAENLVLTETLLRRTVDKHRQEIRDRAVPSLAHKVGTLLDVLDPRIPDTWLDQTIYGPTDINQHEFYAHLPDRVRRMANKYRRAKRQMYQLNGSRRQRGAEEPAAGEASEQVSAETTCEGPVL